MLKNPQKNAKIPTQIFSIPTGFEKGQKNAKIPTPIFSSQPALKKAKFVKFGMEMAKLATLNRVTGTRKS